jgi:hypothetical protein
MPVFTKQNKKKKQKQCLEHKIVPHASTGVARAALVLIVVVPRARILMLETGSEQERELRGGLQGGKLEMESRWGRERKETPGERESERARIGGQGCGRDSRAS